MKKLLLLVAALFVLQGCKIILPKNQVKEETVVDSDSDSDYLYYYIAHSYSRAVRGEKGTVKDAISGIQTESNTYGHLYTYNGEKSVILAEIVSKMADQLLYNLPRKFYNETIALTSMVDLNDLKETNWLGQTISEQFIHELHIRKLPVIDFKLTGNIQVTDKGEFALTRDWKKLNKNVNVQRILTGTMSRNEEGIMINVRIVNANSNIVESTSSAFIPHNIFMGGQYDYRTKKYYSRDSALTNQGKSQVQLVR